MVVCFAALALVLAAANGAAGGGSVNAESAKTVAVEGRARVERGDKDAALDAAKRDARKQAHAKALGMVVASSTVVRNYALVSDVVSEKVRGVILDEGWSAPRTENGTVIIALKARVAPDAIAEGACTALRARHASRVAVIIAADERPQAETATALLAEIQGGCMNATLVNTSGARMERQALIDDVRASGAGDLALFVTPGHLGTTGVSARIVDVVTNEIVAVAAGDARKVADELFKQVAKQWTRELNDGRRVTFTFATTSFAAASLLARAVAQELAVDAAKDQLLRDGELRFSLYLPSDGVAVAKKLDGMRVGDRTVVVTAAEGGAVTLAYAQ